MRVTVDLLKRFPNPFTEEGNLGDIEYRVRKVEYEKRYPFPSRRRVSIKAHLTAPATMEKVELVKAKYGLSWKTGEWVKVEEGCEYPEETRLIIKEEKEG